MNRMQCGSLLVVVMAVTFGQRNQINGDEIQQLIHSLRNARAVLEEQEIDIKSTSKAKVQTVFESTTLINRDQRFFAFVTFETPDKPEQTNGPHFFACIGNQSISLSPEDLKDPYGSTGTIPVSSDRMTKTRGGTTACNLLLYRPSGEDIVSDLEGKNDWRVTKGAEGLMGLHSEKAGTKQSIWINHQDGFPIKRHEFQDAKWSFATTYEGVVRIKGVVALPRVATSTLKMKEEEMELRSEFQNLRPARFPIETDDWKQVTQYLEPMRRKRIPNDR